MAVRLWWGKPPPYQTRSDPALIEALPKTARTANTKAGPSFLVVLTSASSAISNSAQSVRICGGAYFSLAAGRACGGAFGWYGIVFDAGGICG